VGFGKRLPFGIVGRVAAVRVTVRAPTARTSDSKALTEPEADAACAAARRPRHRALDCERTAGGARRWVCGGDRPGSVELAAASDGAGSAFVPSM